MSAQSKTGYGGRVHATGDLLLNCHAAIPGIENAYHYSPSLAAGVVFSVLFGLSFLLHSVRAVQYKRWGSYCLIIGAVVECIGWAGRTWNAQCPYNKAAFLMQISTLVIAPVFFAAAIYLALARLIVRRGPQYSLLKPRAYLWTFCTADFVSLLVQAAGGGMASSASNKNKSPKPGTNVIVTGIVIQLVSMTVFSLCFFVFLWRSRQLHTPRNEQLTILSTLIVLVVVYVRSFYRTIELFQGWTGFLITHEVYFIILDGAMMAIASIAFNVLDPAVLLQDDDREAFDKRGPESSGGSSLEIEEQRAGISEK
jgi:hypothetical protein